MSKTTKTKKKDDHVVFDFYLDFEIKSITFTDKGSCCGNVFVTLNGLNMSLGVMRSADSRLWVSWPCRQSARGRYHALVWPADERVRAMVEQKILTAFVGKQLEKFNIR